MFGFLITFLLSVYLYYKLKNTKKELFKNQKDISRQLFELTILNEVSQKIGYSLSSKDIASTIAQTAQKLFPLSSVSYALIESEHLDLTTVIRQKVGPDYIHGVKQTVLQGIYAVEDSIKLLPVIEKVINSIDTERDLLVDIAIQFDAKPQSYFNIPLVLNNRFTGIINISSSEPHAYQDEDMSMLYKIVNQAQLAIGRLETVIDSEKGKVESLVRSLSSGAIFFSLEKNHLKLFTVNMAARRFLNIESENVDILSVLSKLKVTPNIITEMKDVILQKKSTIYRDAKIGNFHFNIYITPVFKVQTANITGVAITIQDTTAENEIEKLRESFTNMIIHELRAPLTAIKGASTLLSNKNLEDEDFDKMRLIIKNSSERLLEDISHILDSAKIDAGKLTIVKSRADINEIIQNTIEQLSCASHIRSISIDQSLDHDITPFMIDSQRIGQVVSNLISNAVKFSSEGGHITVSSHLEGNNVKVTVQDHGIGIENDKIPSLFKPFIQAELKQRIKGTGLGLYISKAIISEHGGSIELVSQVGEGTTVSFTIPISLNDEKIEAPRASLAN